ncbi:DUF2190 family protein [Hansschlegelia beijingensis]|uniref:DUF2190 family protein n=1 Tax=Hansschlegelia beijingensis TaxID=1133344 RepID=A0A7W6GED4_9HYPH|nr:DUF2190 family protein [Hansschlegelia beijingensis]MBB3972766.1 hypothetical protein [Hansschlegelia beijingensis]
MADLSITAANVIPGADAALETAMAGEAITAGRSVYLSSATKKFLLADTNSGTAEARRARGIAVNSAAAGQPLTIQRGGEIALGAVLTAGVAYYGSDTPGGICPVADIGAGEYVCLLGVAKSSSVLSIGIQFPNVAL